MFQIVRFSVASTFARKKLRPTPVMRLSMRLPLKICLIGLGFLLGLPSSIADAETVRMVKDLNNQSPWKIRYSKSNDRVAFHFRELEDSSEPLSIWRSTADRTEKVNLSIITDDLNEIDDFGHFLTDEYLYVSSKLASELWQMSLDGSQATKVSIRPREAKLYYSSWMQDENTGETFLLFDGPQRKGVRLYKLDEQAATIRPLGPLQENGFYWESTLFGDHVIFTGRDSVWRIDKSGRNPVKLASFGRLNGRYESLNGLSVSYFAISTGLTYQCSLWRTDGTKAGTYSLGNVVNGQGDSSDCHPELTHIRGDLILFKKVDWINRRIEIWQTRGTQASTKLLKRLPLPTIRTRFNPQRSDISLRKVDDSVWYTSYTTNQRPVAWVTDLGFTTRRAIIAGRENGVIDLHSVGGRMLIQIDNDGTYSTLYKSDANGDRLAKVNTGRGHPVSRTIFEGMSIEAVGNQAIMPYKLPGRLREMLIAVDLDTGKMNFRRGWNEISESSIRGRKLIGGPGDTVYFCAANGARSRWNGGVYWGNDGARFLTRLWQTDGTPQNTRAIVSQINKPSTGNGRLSTDCGRFSVGGGRLYFVRERDDVGTELWHANLDGSDQKLFVDILPGSASSHPADVFGLRDGAIFTAAWKDARFARYQPRKLMRAYRDGTIVELSTANFVDIIDRVGDKIWFLATDQRDYDRSWDLWVTDGTRAGTREVATELLVSNIIELNGETYLSAKFPGIRGPGDPLTGLYRITDGASPLELVYEWELEEAHGYQPEIWGSVSKLAAFKGAIYYLQKGTLKRIDVSTGQSTVIVDPDSISDAAYISSFAMLNDQIYFYVRESYVRGTGSAVAAPNWQIWRSEGEIGDAIKIHEQQIPPRSYGSALLQSTGTSIWFVAEDLMSGHELWQLKL